MEKMKKCLDLDLPQKSDHYLSTANKKTGRCLQPDTSTHCQLIKTTFMKTFPSSLLLHHHLHLSRVFVLKKHLIPMRGARGIKGGVEATPKSIRYILLACERRYEMLWDTVTSFNVRVEVPISAKPKRANINQASTFWKLFRIPLLFIWPASDFPSSIPVSLATTLKPKEFNTWGDGEKKTFKQLFLCSSPTLRSFRLF